MARKKAAEIDDSLSSEDKVKALIEKKFGSGIIKSASTILEKEPQIISISPTIDYLFGGGIAKGGWLVAPGKPKIGKTTSLLYALGKMQQAGMTCYFVNAEHRLKKRDLEGIKSLDVPSLNVIGSEEDQILSAEDILEICSTILSNSRNVAMLIDSMSILMEKERQLEYGKQTRGGLGKIVSNFCGMMAATVPLKDHIVMATAHIIANTGGGMATTSEKVGSGYNYQSDYKIKTTWAESWEDSDKNEIGKKIHWQCEWSGLGAPGKKGIGRLRYGVGVDEVAEMMDFAMDLGVIKKSGSWLELYDQKYQGFENMREAISAPEAQEIYQKMAGEVKEML